MHGRPFKFNFNSKMVRLKVFFRLQFFFQLLQFQFQDGTIKSEIDGCQLAYNYQFQFQDGTIKRQPTKIA